jgi:hypothetical protein
MDGAETPPSSTDPQVEQGLESPGGFRALWSVVGNGGGQEGREVREG